MKRIIFFISCIFILFSGCKDDFSPVGQVENNYAAFCVFDNRLEKQYIRLNKIYFDENSKKMPASTKVILTEFGGLNYSFSEVIIPGLEEYNIYCNPDFVLRRGSTYRMTINCEGYPVQWAETSVPNKIAGLIPIMHRHEYKGEVSFSVEIQFPKSNGKVHIIRTFIEYMNKSSLSVGIKEIPIDYELTGKRIPSEKYFFEMSEDYVIPLYPPLVIDNKCSYYSTVGTSSLNMTYNHGLLLYAFQHIPHGGFQKNYLIKRGFVVFYSIDSHIYDYYIKKGKEISSIRLDNPIYPSNFKTEDSQGLGFFGYVVSDTVSFKYHEELILMNGFQDGQY